LKANGVGGKILFKINTNIMPKLKILTIFFFLILGFLGMTKDSQAAVNLPWSTTFNCADWNQYSDPLTCDGLSKSGSWTCSPQGYYEQITSAANYPNGDGGKGQRHWIGDGTSNNSGGLQISFASAQPELWIRWYFRYQSGFKWSSLKHHKLIYIRTAVGTSVIPEWYGSDGYRIYAVGGGGGYVCSSGCGWNTIYPGGVSDGSWHYLEVHLKMDTNGSNGVGQVWLDGVLKYTITNANFSTQPGWTWFNWPENAADPANGGCYYEDVDDIAISNTGYIGPVVPSPVTHNVTCSAGSYASCSCNSPVNNGATTTCTATPNSGYQIASGSSTCGGSLSGNIFTTGAVTSDCAVTFTTSAIDTTPPATPSGLQVQ